MSELLYRRLLMKAADRLGTTPRLARALNVSDRELSRWLTGASPIPPAILHKVVDLLAVQGSGKSARALNDKARANSALEAAPH